MAGNVWEWTMDEAEQAWFWAKGGSWYDDKEQAKASTADDGHIGGTWDNGVGFRVVVVPISR